MNIDSFNVENFLPYYLTEDQKIKLAGALKSFSEHSNLYTHLFMDEALQGDCWNKVPYRDFLSGDQFKIHSLIISNSCDISEENDRDFPVNITFAPIFSYSKYENALVKSGIPKASIESKLASIRQQKITHLLYLPAGGNLQESGIAHFDKIFSLPYSIFKKDIDKNKVTTLSQLGHYLLSFKMSIHFCRLQENVPRN